MASMAQLTLKKRYGGGSRPCFAFQATSYPTYPTARPDHRDRGASDAGRRQSRWFCLDLQRHHRAQAKLDSTNNIVAIRWSCWLAEKPLPSILDAIVSGLEQLKPAMLCSIRCSITKAKRLHIAAAPSRLISMLNFQQSTISKLAWVLAPGRPLLWGVRHRGRYYDASLLG